MSIDVGGGGEGAVAQPDLNLFHRDAVAQQKAGTSVPIGYNKDKSGNLVFARGFGFVLILFPQKKPLKRGNENGGDKARCYIKDKKQLGNFGG